HTQQVYTVLQHNSGRATALPPFGAETAMNGLLKQGTPAGTASLTVGGKTIELPVMKGSVGPDVIDVRALYNQTGRFTFDPGFTSTAACESTITYIDGDEGILLYRGYPIDQLAAQGNFMETCYVLLNGQLPTKKELSDFENKITYHTMVHEQLAQFFRGF